MSSGTPVFSQLPTSKSPPASCKHICSISRITVCGWRRIHSEKTAAPASRRQSAAGLRAKTPSGSKLTQRVARRFAYRRWFTPRVSVVPAERNPENIRSRAQGTVPAAPASLPGFLSAGGGGALPRWRGAAHWAAPEAGGAAPPGGQIPEHHARG